MKKPTLFYYQAVGVLVLLVLSITTNGQINGQNPVTFGTTTTYTFDNGNIYAFNNWQITYGTINSTSSSGTTYSCNVTWGSSCVTGTLTFRSKTLVISSLNVTINPSLPTPSTSFTTTLHCQYSTITRSDSPPSGVTWYWQTTSTGTDTSYPDADYNVYSAGYYYLRPFACGQWGSSQQTTLVHGIINPAAPTGTNGTRCGPGTVVISATPDTQGDNIRWYDASSGGTLLGTGTSFTTPSISILTYYYAASLHTETNCESNSRTLVSANVYPVPDASASGQTICSGQTTSISISNPNGTPGTSFSWTVNASGVSGASNGSGSSIAQTLSVTAEATGTVTYTITPSTSNCSGTPINAVVTVQALGTPSGTFSTTSYCQSVDITRNGSPPSGITWYWQTSSSGTSTSNSGATYNATTSGYYYLRAYGCSTWSTNSLSTSYITVPVLPSVPSSVIGGSRCGTGTVGLSASLGAGGDGIKWYAASSGGTALATGTSFTTPSISSTTTYYACTYISSSGCESSRIAVTATINPLPGDATLPLSTPGDLYGPGTVTLSASGASGGETYAWYTVSTGGSPLPSTTVSVSTTITYYVSRIITTTGCESANRASVTVSVFAVPSVTPALPDTITYGGSVTLTANSGYYSYQWYRNSTLIPGKTSQTLNATEPGSYYVEVKGTSTSSPATSNAVVVLSRINSYVGQLNSVSTTTVLAENITEGNSIYSLADSLVSQTVSYMDGLGRTFQTIAVGQSPSGGDLVTVSAPSLFGVADTTFLPYAVTTRSGKYRKLAIRGSSAYNSYSTSEQYLFYQNATKVAHDTYPYARSVYRNDPSFSVSEQGAPGIDWQPGNNHTMKSEMALNNSSTYRVRYWNTAGATSANYPDSSVVVSVVTDENGNKVRTFTDPRGLTVLKQVQIDETIDSVYTDWLETYYIYDIFGRISIIVPPKAMKVLGTGSSLDATSSSVEELVFRFTYDSQGRLIKKKVPGSTEQYLVYDIFDRIVLVQDAHLRALNKWMFVKYDSYGRSVISGLYENSDTLPKVQAWVSKAYTTSSSSYPRQNFAEKEGTTAHGYTNVSFPKDSVQYLGVNYFDNYDFTGDNTADFTYDNTHLSGQETASLSNVRGFATGSKRLTISADGTVGSTWLQSAVFYDRFDRAIQVQSSNHLYPSWNSSTLDKSTVIYDFVKVVKTKVTQYQSSSISLSYVDRSDFDHAGRVTKVYRKIGSDSEQLVAKYEYNELGQLVDKKLHNTTGETYLQSVDLRYTIRGWLSSINNSQLTNDGTLNDDTGDYFGMEIAYNTSAGMSNTTYYNGNISAVKWRSFGTTGADDQRSYKYTYDKSDRLKTATFQAYEGSTWTKEANTLNESLTYDHNGNIRTLQRKRNLRGLDGTDVTSTAETIDELTYKYAAVNGGFQNSNRMIRVNEAAAGTAGDEGFKNGQDSDTEFVYGNDGSMTKDENKGISDITYNFLGKPRVVTFTSGKRIEYAYDAAGTKLTVDTYSGDTLKTRTNYSGGSVYEGSSPELSFFASPEGRVVMNGSSYEYQYAIGDHLGNTRVLFTSVAPSASTSLATFEAPQTYGFSVDTTRFEIFNAANHTYLGHKAFQINQSNPIGPSKSLKVYPGDTVNTSVWAYFEDEDGFGNSSPSNSVLIAAIASAFGGIYGGGGESEKIFDGVNNALTGFGLGGNVGDEAPGAYLNYILFDQEYNVLSAGWSRVPAEAYFSKEEVTLDPIPVTEAGYVFVYLSYEDESNNYVYFDDFSVIHTKSRLIQCDEYYPFGMQTANSWTREGNTGNNFLGNGGTELSPISKLYDLDYRSYDPVLGRLNGVDPKATKFTSLTPYNYSFNDPVSLTDVSGGNPEDGPYGGNSAYYYAMQGPDGMAPGQEALMDPFGGVWNPAAAGGYGVNGAGLYNDASVWGWFAGFQVWNVWRDLSRTNTQAFIERNSVLTINSVPIWGERLVPGQDPRAPGADNDNIKPHKEKYVSGWRFLLLTKEDNWSPAGDDYVPQKSNGPSRIDGMVLNADNPYRYAPSIYFKYDLKNRNGSLFLYSSGDVISIDRGGNLKSENIGKRSLGINLMSYTTNNGFTQLPRNFSKSSLEDAIGPYFGEFWARFTEGDGTFMTNKPLKAFGSYLFNNPFSNITFRFRFNLTFNNSKYNVVLNVHYD